MFRLKASIADVVDKDFLSKAKPIMNYIYHKGGKCYCLRVDDGYGIVLPYFMVVSNGFTAEVEQLCELITKYDKTPEDMQTNTCIEYIGAFELGPFIEMYEED